MSENLMSLPATRAVLDRFGIRARKRYGQNFIIDASVVEDMMEAGHVSRKDTILEIGPGIGSMTQILSQDAGRVIAVEIDHSMEKVLQETLRDCDNVKVLYQDILKTDLKQIRDEWNGGRPFSCIANLPYYITTPILDYLLHCTDCFERITVMLQKEVAERILAKPGTKEYGVLTLMITYYAKPVWVRDVSSECFFPRPGVDSAVISLTILDSPSVVCDEDWMFQIIRAAFHQRRKTLANALSHGLSQEGIAISKEEVQSVLRDMNRSELIRGEDLSLEEYADLSFRLHRKPL